MLGTNVGKKVTANLVQDQYNEFLKNKDHKNVVKKPQMTAEERKMAKREEMRKRGIMVKADDKDEAPTIIEKGDGEFAPCAFKLPEKPVKWKKGKKSEAPRKRGRSKEQSEKSHGSEKEQEQRSDKKFTESEKQGGEKEKGEKKKKEKKKKKKGASHGKVENSTDVKKEKSKPSAVVLKDGGRKREKSPTLELPEESGGYKKLEVSEDNSAKSIRKAKVESAKAADVSKDQKDAPVLAPENVPPKPEVVAENPPATPQKPVEPEKKDAPTSSVPESKSKEQEDKEPHKEPSGTKIKEKISDLSVKTPTAVTATNSKTSTVTESTITLDVKQDAFGTLDDEEFEKAAANIPNQLNDEDEKDILRLAPKILKIAKRHKAMEKCLTAEENETLAKFFSGKKSLTPEVLATLDVALDKIIDHLHKNNLAIDEETKRIIKHRDKLKAAMMKEFLVSPQYLPKSWTAKFNQWKSEAEKQKNGVNWFRILFAYPKHKSFDDGPEDIFGNFNKRDRGLLIGLFLGPGDVKSFEETKREEDCQGMFLDTKLIEHAGNEPDLTSATKTYVNLEKMEKQASEPKISANLNNEKKGAENEKKKEDVKDPPKVK
ncbi:unnamed protein product [Caenorhabditis angaria]|uniref:DUF7774 domain-containing protein n=1 Tax=Caenorhabditis angaria TaxID=860376 RepID=A0A9P1ICK1_9PELO|nr:unnamed protein product [Caenorhabditis angaria]